MKLKIKAEYVDVFISCPFTRKNVNTLFLDENLYIPYYHKGYNFIFEEIVDETEVKEETIKEVKEVNKKKK